MGFFSDLNSRIKNPMNLGLLCLQKSRRQNPEKSLRIGIFFEQNPEIPKNPEMFLKYSVNCFRLSEFIIQSLLLLTFITKLKKGKIPPYGILCQRKLKILKIPLSGKSQQIIEK